MHVMPDFLLNKIETNAWTLDSLFKYFQNNIDITALNVESGQAVSLGKKRELSEFFIWYVTATKQALLVNNVQQIKTNEINNFR